MKTVTAALLIQNVPRLDIKILSGKELLEKCQIGSSRVQRPGLVLAGHFEHIRSSRIELFGETELNFMKTLTPERRTEVLSRLASLNNCLFVISRNLTPPPELMEVATQFSIPVISTAQTTVQTDNEISYFLDYELAPETILHGVCVEVYGMGIVITGQSGIGKSECALELIKKGHRLVADDIIHIKRRHHYLVGSSNEMLKDHIELRGVGILNIPYLFGITSVRRRKKIDLVIEFLAYEEWNNREDTDRLGLGGNIKTLMDIEIPHILCPVSPGRNMSEIVELAVKNQIIKLAGFDSTAAFARTINTKAGHSHSENGE